MPRLRRADARGAKLTGKVLAAALAGACAAAWACTPPEGVDVAQERRTEFVYERHGGLCATPDGGGLCRLRVEVHDDGRWTATGTPEPPAAGQVRLGAASELAAIFESGYPALSAQPFTDICPTAYDGSETSYLVRHVPTGPDAPRADAVILSASSCTNDFTHPSAQAALTELRDLWRTLRLPE